MKTEIDHEENAKMLYFQHHEGKTPDGWEYISLIQSTYRHVYKCPNGYVYKICKDEYDDANLDEIESYKRIEKSHKSHAGWEVAPVLSVSVPTSDGDRMVNVMPYIEGVHENPDYDQEVDADTAFSTFDLYDAHQWNYILTQEGKRIIIDMGA